MKKLLFIPLIFGALYAETIKITSVKTYLGDKIESGGAIPLSQESIDDADVDLVSLVSESISQIKVNTTNDAIATVLKTFTAKTVKNLDEMKALLNGGFDPAYNVSLIVSQSFYQTLDTLKDGNGRYLLQDDITAVSGKTLLGKPVFVLSDEVLGANKAFVGDFKRGVLFADRKDLGLRWADNEIYGQYLQAVLRFGVTKVDEKAGYYVTYTPAP
jgi:HK97 family phage major capsid protein